MPDSACVFCKIARKEIPAQEIARTEEAVVFADLDPKAPSHLLVIPVRHAENLGDFTAMEGPAAAGALFALASKVGREAAPSGAYRIVVNEGAEAGQTVFHLHLHVLAGRRMAWPPG
jgi:diadenosine tetraphosphate (Ap4A) HIT family hydrolase